MGVLYHAETTKDRGSSGTLEETTYKRSFKIVTDGSDTITDVYAFIATQYNVRPGAAHPNNSLARCVGADPKNDKSPSVWVITASYTTKFDHKEDPVEDEIVITGDEEDFQRPLIYDFMGDPVLNSAGDPPSEPLMAEDSNSVLTIVANVSTIPLWYYTYKKSINSDWCVIDGEIVAPRRARLKSRSKSWWKYRGDTAYRQITLKIEIRDPDEPDFRYRWLDQGWRRLPTPTEVATGVYSNDDRVDIKVRGQEPKKPVLLNGTGAILPNPNPDNAVFNITIFHPERTFAGVIPGCLAYSG